MMCTSYFWGFTLLLAPSILEPMLFAIMSLCHTHSVNDDGAGDGRNALIVERLMPDRDYYVQFQMFHPQGGKFEFVITAW